jgi:DNA-binding transcriptional MerR regulator
VSIVEPQYTIEEAAHRTGVSTHTLRYYERIGLLEPVGRAASGHRRYTDADLGSVTFLTCLRQTGMPIRQMQQFVELTRAGDATVPDRIDALVAHQEALAEQIALLRRHFEALRNKIEYYREVAAEQRGTSARSALAQDDSALLDNETQLVDKRSTYA